MVSLSGLGGLEENKSVEEAPTVAKCLWRVAPALPSPPKKNNLQLGAIFNHSRDELLMTEAV